jgi:hypothetical protein
MDSNKNQVPAVGVGGAVPPGLATEQGGWWWSRISEVGVDGRCRELSIESWPVGDLRHMWAVLLKRLDEPTAGDVLKAAGGAWLYRTLRLSLYVDKPPVDIYMSVHTHKNLSAVRRAYLYPTDLMPKFRETAFEGAYHATHSHYFAQIDVATLPGDRIFIHLDNKTPFRGRLTVLSC